MCKYLLCLALRNGTATTSSRGVFAASAPKHLAMRLLWLHKPHACKTCGAIIDLAYPTCATDACRKVWRRASLNKAKAAIRKAKVEARRCRDCSRRLPQDVTSYRCAKCAKKHRDAQRRKAQDKAYEMYMGKLALAHIEREMERKRKQQAAAERAERERTFQEVREIAQRGWVDEHGDSMAEEV
jgi:hypothetical protein